MKFVYSQTTKKCLPNPVYYIPSLNIHVTESAFITIIHAPTKMFVLDQLNMNEIKWNIFSYKGIGMAENHTNVYHVVNYPVPQDIIDASK